MRKSLIPILPASLLVLSGVAAAAAAGPADDEAQIRALTREFCEAVVAGDLSILDRLFDPSPENVFYDINEGPFGLERLKRVWRAATTNYKLTRFEFTDTKIVVDGDRALETGSWEQTHVTKEGASEDIAGRATILWKRTPEGWRVVHYHASVTPRRPGRPTSP